MVMDSADAEKALEPPAKRQKAEEEPLLAECDDPPPFGGGYVPTDGGWFAHKGGQWLYNKEEKTFFHLPTGKLHMETEDGLISLTADAGADAAAGAAEAAAPAVVERRRGVVKWFNSKKGFGFIAPDSGEETKDLFVHRNQLLDAEGDPFFSIETDAKVSFAIGETDNGRPCAVQVQVEQEDEGTGAAEGGPDAGDEEAVDDGEGSCASSGSSVELDLEAELHSGEYSKKGATKDNCEDFAVTNIKIPVFWSEAATCIFYGVFDGHGGFTCAEYAAAHLCKNILARLNGKTKTGSDEVAIKSALLGGFGQTEHNFLQRAKNTKDFSGSTACTMTLFGPDENQRLRLFMANAGDSRAVLGRVDGKAIRLTEDHKPTNKEEKKRIVKNGGTVADINGCWRCMLPRSKQLTTGIVGLAVSRALGDKEFKNPDIVSAEPEITIHDVDWDNDELVIIASDGIWDVITDKMAVRIVQESFRNGQSEEAASEELVKRAISKGSKDDCTVVVVRFGWVKTTNKSAAAADGLEAGDGDAEEDAGARVTQGEQDDDEDEEEADLEGGLSINPSDIAHAPLASAEDSAEDLDNMFGDGDTSSVARAEEPGMDDDDDDDDDDEYNLVGGTSRLNIPSADASAGSSAASAPAAQAAPGLFDDLVPTREEIALPQGPTLPGDKAVDDGMDMFG